MNLLRDPLVGFLLAGAAIFGIYQLHPAAQETRVIEITDAQIQRISDQWRSQTGRSPDSEELNGLLEAWIREEILYRQALTMGLEQNDTIIRRRLVQKLSFLTEDSVDTTPGSESELLAFYDKSPQTYSEPERFSFEHVYFSEEQRQHPEMDARRALEEADRVGDPFMLPRSYANRSQQDVRDLFGREFAETLATLQQSDAWQGPVWSAYGWHLVRLTKRQPARLLPFEEVRNRVTSDLQQVKRRAANDALYQKLRSEYEIRTANKAQ